MADLDELQASNLWKHYQGSDVVRGVNLTLIPGEITALLGPNGAGKTTTVGMLYGAVRPDRGAVTLCGIDMLREGREARRHLGVVTQENNLDPELNVRENLLFFAHHYRLRGEAAKARARELIAQLGLKITQRKFRKHSLAG